MHHRRTRPYTPRTNGKAERFIQTALREWAYARPYYTSTDRARLLLGWWAPYPGTSRRILISDHLYNCVRSVETNLVEARLHLIEAMDFWERESDFHARAVSMNM